MVSTNSVSGLVTVFLFFFLDCFYIHIWPDYDKRKQFQEIVRVSVYWSFKVCGKNVNNFVEKTSEKFIRNGCNSGAFMLLISMKNAPYALSISLLVVLLLLLLLHRQHYLSFETCPPVDAPSETVRTHTHIHKKHREHIHVLFCISRCNWLLTRAA